MNPAESRPKLEYSAAASKLPGNRIGIERNGSELTVSSCLFSRTELKKVMLLTDSRETLRYWRELT